MRYQELLTDFHQGNQQSGLDLAGEVDVERFTCDQEYKEDIILGLAMFPNLDKWSLNLSLARRYGVPLLWPVYVTHRHLQILLTSNQLTSSEAGQLVEDRNLMGVWLRTRRGARSGWWMVTLVSEAGNINIDFKLLEEGNKEAFKFINKENVDIQLLKFWIFLPTRM